MKRGIRAVIVVWFAMALMLGASSLVVGCGEEDDNNQSGGDKELVDEGCTTDVEHVCAKVFECGGWGWNDLEECKNGFINNPDYQTECANETAYFACVCNCLDLSCNAFSDCEGGCWEDTCRASEGTE